MTSSINFPCKVCGKNVNDNDNDNVNDNVNDQVIQCELCNYQIHNNWARSLVVSDLRSETKGSRFESGCQLCVEVSSLQ